MANERFPKAAYRAHLRAMRHDIENWEWRYRLDAKKPELAHLSGRYEDRAGVCEELAHFLRAAEEALEGLGRLA
jgi:hypothetical protein